MDVVLFVIVLGGPGCEDGETFGGASDLDVGGVDGRHVVPGAVAYESPWVWDVSDWKLSEANLIFVFVCNKY